MEYISDRLLMYKIRAGDEEACARLVEKYYSDIYQYCLLHMYDSYDAEDLTQEVFTSFFTSVDRYREYGKVKNYLYTIARNTVINYYKKKKDIPVDEVPEYENDNKNSMHNIEVKMYMEQVLRKLPKELREVAILYFFQELKQKEIAELLDIKLSLVKYRIGRAKELLKVYLEVERDE